MHRNSNRVVLSIISVQSGVSVDLLWQESDNISSSPVVKFLHQQQPLKRLLQWGFVSLLIWASCTCVGAVCVKHTCNLLLLAENSSILVMLVNEPLFRLYTFCSGSPLLQSHTGRRVGVLHARTTHEQQNPSWSNGPSGQISAGRRIGGRKKTSWNNPSGNTANVCQNPVQTWCPLSTEITENTAGLWRQYYRKPAGYIFNAELFRCSRHQNGFRHFYAELTNALEVV